MGGPRTLISIVRVYKSTRVYTTISNTHRDFEQYNIIGHLAIANSYMQISWLHACFMAAPMFSRME